MSPRGMHEKNSRRTHSGDHSSVNAEDHYYLGVDRFAEGKLVEAIVEYQRAIEADPQFADALHGLAQAHYASLDFDAAITAARRILEIDPEDVLAWTTISRAYQRKGMVPEAEESAAKARVLGWKKQLKEKKE
jgi:tetratricopeptide (TPR) repeat protein